MLIDMAACRNGRLTFSKGPPGGDTILTWSSVGLSDHNHPAYGPLRPPSAQACSPEKVRWKFCEAESLCSSSVSVWLSADPMCHVKILVIQS